VKPEWSRAVTLCFPECQGTTLTLTFYLKDTDISTTRASENSVFTVLAIIVFKNDFNLVSYFQKNTLIERKKLQFI
jgi:hypothetical protein